MESVAVNTLFGCLSISLAITFGCYGIASAIREFKESPDAK